METLDRCHDEYSSSSNKKDDSNKCPQDCTVTDATFPHGTCSSGANGLNPGIIHPTEEKQEICEDCESIKKTNNNDVNQVTIEIVLIRRSNLIGHYYD